MTRPSRTGSKPSSMKSGESRAEASPPQAAETFAAISCLTSEPERIECVVKWILTGAREMDVLEAIQAHWPNTDHRPLVAAAVGQLADAGNFDGGVVRGFCVEATKQLYRQMVELGDFAGALRAVQLLHRMAQEAS